MYVAAQDVRSFLDGLPDMSIDLLLTDPPFYGIVQESWDNQWRTLDEFVAWLDDIFTIAHGKLKDTGSLVFFGGIGRHRKHPLLQLIIRLEASYQYRNWITWGKKRAYGKKKDYLFCREEILWFTRSDQFTFNVPYLDEKRGYSGYNPKYPAKSEYKRVTNVWSDITELLRPKRPCQKPEKLIARLVATHSNPGDLVVDPFAGYGTTGIATLAAGRRFQGCEIIPEDAAAADQRCLAVVTGGCNGTTQQLETNNPDARRAAPEALVQEAGASAESTPSETEPRTQG